MKTLYNLKALIKIEMTTKFVKPKWWLGVTRYEYKYPNNPSWWDRFCGETKITEEGLYKDDGSKIGQNWIKIDESELPEKYAIVKTELIPHKVMKRPYTQLFYSDNIGLTQIHTSIEEQETWLENLMSEAVGHCVFNIILEDDN